VNPVAYRAIGDSFAVFASNGGRDANPAWYHNLLAHPDVTVEVGTETIAVRARETEGSERDRIWEQQKAERPAFAEYETKTSRQIPVLILDQR
jgi:deazaflavin-dependent oxidoreductase (nitroreductase family)